MKGTGPVCEPHMLDPAHGDGWSGLSTILIMHPRPALHAECGVWVCSKTRGLDNGALWAGSSTPLG